MCHRGANLHNYWSISVYTHVLYTINSSKSTQTIKLINIITGNYLSTYIVYTHHVHLKILSEKFPRVDSLSFTSQSAFCSALLTYANPYICYLRSNITARSYIPGVIIGK